MKALPYLRSFEHIATVQHADNLMVPSRWQRTRRGRPILGPKGSRLIQLLPPQSLPFPRKILLAHSALYTSSTVINFGHQMLAACLSLSPPTRSQMAEKIARRRRRTNAEEADLCLELHAGIYLRLKSEENASTRESTPKKPPPQGKKRARTQAVLILE